MHEALRFARRSIGSVEPNPAVAAVVVRADKVIGKGRHRRFGGAHAEVEAIKNCRKKGHTTEGATMYVTLEPCCHHGKTGPCTEAIIESGIAEVIIAAEDPSEHCRGKGIKQLKETGIKVAVGICEQQARLLNAGFFKFVETGRPWVILKWAQSIDGNISRTNCAENRWISGQKSREDVQGIRRRVQAIMVGVKTVIDDDPLLTARPARKQPLLRVVLDSNLKIPLDCRLLDTIKQAPVVIMTTIGAAETQPHKARQLTEMGAKVLAVPAAKTKCDIEAVLARLAEMGVQEVLIEGGVQVIASALQADITDEIITYIAPEVFGQTGRKNIAGAMQNLINPLRLKHIQIDQFGDDVRISGLVREII